MSVIVGSDGRVQFDLGGGMLCTANVFSWTARLGRETLPTTKQGDEARTRTAGLADHTGSFSLRLQFSEDDSVANSAWQLLDFALNNNDDFLKARIRLYLQKDAPLKDCNDVFPTVIETGIRLTGTVVITEISVDCTDPGEPMVAVVGWEADGALQLRGPNFDPDED